MGLAETIAQAVPASGAKAEQAAGNEAIVIAGASAIDVLTFLKNDDALSFNALVDLTAVDRRETDGCFYVVYILASHKTLERVIVRARLEHAPDDDGLPTIPTASGLWQAANWAEREVYDLFGVAFEGHPDLRRILMYEEFVGHPLRKDYPVDKRQPLVEERDPIADPWPSRDGR